MPDESHAVMASGLAVGAPRRSHWPPKLAVLSSPLECDSMGFALVYRSLFHYHYDFHYHQ